MMRESTIRRRDWHSDRFWSRPPFWLGIVVLFFAAIIFAWGMHFENQSNEAKEASVIAPWDPSWPPLPASGFISHPLELIRAAYAFAARRREVFALLLRLRKARTPIAGILFRKTPNGNRHRSVGRDGIHSRSVSRGRT